MGINVDNSRTEIRDEKLQNNLRVCERGRKCVDMALDGLFLYEFYVKIDRGSDKKWRWKSSLHSTTKEHLEYRFLIFYLNYCTSEEVKTLTFLFL